MQCQITVVGIYLIHLLLKSPNINLVTAIIDSSKYLKGSMQQYIPKIVSGLYVLQGSISSGKFVPSLVPVGMEIGDHPWGPVAEPVHFVDSRVK